MPASSPGVDGFFVRGISDARRSAAADNTITDSSTVIISLFTFIYCLLFFYLLLPRGTGERRLRINNI